MPDAHDAHRLAKIERVDLKNPINFGQLVDKVRTESIESLKQDIEKRSSFNSEVKLDRLAKRAKLWYQIDKQNNIGGVLAPLYSKKISDLASNQNRATVLSMFSMYKFFIIVCFI